MDRYLETAVVYVLRYYADLHNYRALYNGPPNFSDSPIGKDKGELARFVLGRIEEQERERGRRK